jgi:hypothetical protein
MSRTAVQEVTNVTPQPVPVGPAREGRSRLSYPPYGRDCADARCFKIRALLVDELIQAVMQGANLSAAQAAAVAVVLRILTARLPSALAGQLHAWLDDSRKQNGSFESGESTKQ